jgi:3-hydroxyisobutyrate dehydrogenase
MESKNISVGFIGLGVMGRSMAGHLMAAGYRLNVFNRTKNKADELIQRGAVWCDTPAVVAARSDVVITMVGYPRDVEEIYLGEKGLVANARRDAVLIDMTTSSPELAQRIAIAAAARGRASLDAPVTGGDKGAREATLTILVGGDAAAFERVHPLFAVMGRNIVHCGTAGMGQHAKLANQIAIAGALQGVCEALAYAQRMGLDARQVQAAISGGAAGSWQLQNLGPKMLAGDFAPGFFAKHFIKDMELASRVAGEQNLNLPSLQLALERFRQLAAEGGAELGTQALFQLYHDAAKK